MENIYHEIDELIKELDIDNNHRISEILQHRMYKVSWTSSSELFEELQNILKKYLQEEINTLNKSIIEHINDILRKLENVK